MKVIDGKKIANKVKDEIAGKVQEMMKAGQPVPHLAAVIVGDDGAAKTYVDSICKACKEVGFVSSIYHYPAEIKEEDFLQNLDFLNNDDEIDGYIIQMPLPKHISMEKVVEHVNPKKDVDCFHPTNNGKLLLGGADFLPATPYGTVELMRRSGISPKGKHCVVLGRSNIVGKPLALLLAEKSDTGDATVTICHSRTQNLKEVCATADILLVAIGQLEKTVQVVDSPKSRVGAPLVPQYMTDLTPPEEYERVKMLNMRFEHRDRGEGRPTKRDRRQIEYIKNLYGEE